MNHSERFRALDELLTAQQKLWQPAPFCQSSLPWSEHYPDLQQALMALTEAEVEELEQDERALLAFLTPHIPVLQALPELLDLPVNAHHLQFNPHWCIDISGRKLQQIAAFAGALSGALSKKNGEQSKSLHSVHLVDWCAGKSHLGRLLSAYSGASFIAIERDQKLCQQGIVAADKLRLSAQFICADVLASAQIYASALSPETHALALHACGDLHTTLMHLSVQQSVRHLSIAPCCYHKQRAPLYTPLSILADRTALRLDRALLHLAVEETVTSSAKVCAQRDQMALWRLAFDEWQRQHTGVDAYMPTPSLPYSVLSQGLPAFILKLAVASGLTYTTVPDYDLLLKRAALRQRVVRRAQLVRHGFRRALELWLVLDRVLYLQENGYRIRLSVFCQRALTPRNLLIDATLA